jgi:hypothetical protein
MDIATKLQATHKINMPGAVLLALLERMMEEVIKIERLLTLLKESDNLHFYTSKAPKEAIEELQKDLEATTAMGVVLFKEAIDLFGEEFINDFVEGKEVIPPVPVHLNASSTLN